MSAEVSHRDHRVSFGLAHDIARAWLDHWKGWITALFGIAVGREPGLAQISFTHRHIEVRSAGASASSQILLDTETDERSPLARLRREVANSDLVEVVLPENEVLRPKLRLPKASRGVLRKALQFELARFSPIDPAQLYFDFETSEPQAGASEIEVSIRAVRRDAADAAVARCHAAGLKVARFRFANDPRAARWTALPADRAALLLAQWQQWKLIALTVLTLGLALALLLSAYLRADARAAALETSVSEARAPAAVAAHLRGEIQALEGTESFLRHRKQSTLFISVLADLSKSLPDDTWLTSLQISGGKIRIAGYSRSPSHIFNEVAAAGFRKSQFESPLVYDGAEKADRFDLSFEAAP